MNIIDVDQQNVAEKGFFCMMSKRKSEGYRRKLNRLSARFAEGLKIKMLDLSEGGRGFIEYIPGEYAWRAVDAKGYLFIHCLWIVGKSKGKGYGNLLLNECIGDAKKMGMKGVAMVTSQRPWLLEKRFLEKNGFELVDHASPSFGLVVRKFGRARPPTFTDNWDAKLRQCGRDLTIFRSDQCPYIDDAVKIIVDIAEQLEINSRVVNLQDCRSVREASPSPYGVFNIVYNGSLLSYHYLTKKEFLKRLDGIEKQPQP